jgi:hypothetical protein
MHAENYESPTNRMQHLVGAANEITCRFLQLFTSIGDACPLSRGNDKGQFKDLRLMGENAGKAFLSSSDWTQACN